MTSIAEHLTAEQVKAARALLAWSQQDLAQAARVATSTVADFERGARTPVANNAQAIREALEQAGLEFLAAGVVSKAMLPPPPAPPRAGGLVRWVNATHLSQWGETRSGQSGMPELVRRLVYASVGAAAQIRFPSDESVQYAGWDGVSVVADGRGYVPSGTSVWEIGTQRRRIGEKAEEDFAKRTADPLGRDLTQTTFVFVTPQRFVGKDEWVAAKKARSLWRDVVVIDADDLVHWLETCPAVAQWLSVRIGRRPRGLRNLEEAWSEWAGTTAIPLTADVVLTGREDEQTAVLKWLRGEPSQFSVQAEAPEEALAFLHASLSPLPQAYRLHYLGRCVVADSAETARELVGLGTPLIVAMTEPDPGLAQRLVSDGHHVFGAFGSNAAAVNLQRLQRPWRHDLELALCRAGVTEDKAHQLAHASGRSVTVLRRLMPAAPHARTPWASPATPELIAAMFAGGWSDTAPKDRQIISDLAGRPYEDVASVLAPLAGVGGPLVRSGLLWKVVSLQDLWTQIGAQVTNDQVKRFESAFQSVLGTINPRYDHRPNHGGFEEPGEFGEECTGALRRGLTEAMIAMAVYPGSAEQLPHLETRVGAAVRKLLDGAAPALWWSLSQDFQNLAEAAPEAFLEALDRGLEGDDPALNSLFRSEEGMLHRTEYLSNLLWALEMLARSPRHLGHAARVLAELDAIDPGGTWSNRPAASLRRIFLSWSPQTYASVEERLKVLDRIVRALPDVGWKLLVSLAPRHHDTSQPSSKPTWRDFSTDRPEVLTWQSVGRASQAFGERLLAQVGDDAGRWGELLEFWANFDPTWREAAAQQLLDTARRLSDPKAIETLRDKVRALVQKHRDFSEAQWAVGEDDLAPLDAVIDALQPQGVADRVRWLFKPGAAGMARDWRARQQQLEMEQAAAAEALLEACDEDEIFAFAESVPQRHGLGFALSRTSADRDTKFALMKRGMLADDDASADVGLGLLLGLMSQAGQGQEEGFARTVWRRAIDEGWGERAELRIVRRLPNNATTWSEIEARSSTLADAYWKALEVYWIDTVADPDLVVGKLMAAGRPTAAVFWLGANIELGAPATLMIEALRAAARAVEPLEGNDATMFSHYVGEILKRLDQDPTVDETALVEIEWTYFHLLRHSDRPARTLHRALSQDPEFFTHLVSLIYLPAKDSGVVEPPAEDQEQLQRQAEQAWHVLHDWAHVPGADDKGEIDGLALETWVKTARKRLSERGRGEVGDSLIGQVLAASRRTPGEPWPPTPVREIIEMVRSRALESGFEVGVYNRRGVTVRMPRDGGEQERVLAETYRGHAEALRFDWPRTAASLDRIATTYDLDATREDLSAEQRDWL